MDRDGIRQFMRQIGAQGIRDEPEWVMSSCPLAFWTHDSRRDSNPSFGISVHDDDVSIFNCFTCHRQGTLTRLLELLEKFTGDDYSDLREQFAIGEELGPPLGSWDAARKERGEKLGEPIDLSWLDLYEDPMKYKLPRLYLMKRGIVSKVVCKRLQLRYDPEEGRVLFPVFDRQGQLYGFTGRACSRKTQLRVKDYQGLQKKFMVLGAHLIRESDDKVVVVEGPFDYAVLQSYGYPAAALLGTAFTEEKVQTLVSFGKPIYLFMDNDSPGRDASLRYAEALIRHVPVFDVAYPPLATGLDPATLPEKWVHRMIEGADLYGL